MVETRDDPPQVEDGSLLARFKPLSQRGWSEVWQGPLLLAGLAVFILGLYHAAPTQTVHDFAGRLDDIEHLLNASKGEEAMEVINQLQPYLPEMEPKDVGRFWQYSGDARHMRLRVASLVPLRTDAAQSFRQLIVACYAKAQEAGRVLPPASIRRLAQAYAELHRTKDAVALIDQFEFPWQRCNLLRDLIQQQLNRDDHGDLDTLTSLTQRFQDELRAELDPQRRRQQAIWIARLEAVILRSHGDIDGAIGLLLRRLQQLDIDSEDRNDLAPLYILLAQAYQAAGGMDDARRYFETAHRMLDERDGLMAQVLTGLAQLTLAEPGDQGVSPAMQMFSQVIEDFPSEDVATDALVGRADCYARQESWSQAIEDFGRAIAATVRMPSNASERKGLLVRTVRTHVMRCVERKQFEEALNLLSLLRPLYPGAMPTGLLLDFAQVEHKLADQLADRAAALDPRHPGLSQTSEQVKAARDMALRQAANHYERAAMAYQDHARRVSAVDDAAYASSLWNAADSFDKAQRWEQAIIAFEQFVTTRKEDSQQLSARERLARSYMADSQYEAAAKLIESLVGDHPNSPQAVASMVPLARCYMATNKEPQAEQTLLAVTENHPAITPDSQPYREALLELGKLYAKLGDNDPAYFPRAIERLETALQRYGDRNDVDSATIDFLLGDTYRKSVAQLDKAIRETQDAERVEALVVERNRRLQRAQECFDDVLTRLDSFPPESLTDLERVRLRNALFYRAHAAFDRGDYELAIDYYDQAARRCVNEPASLIALVQIVNARCELGQFDEARIANRHARDQLKRLPDEAFANDPALPMTRKQWEDWLRWTGELDAQTKP